MRTMKRLTTFPERSWNMPQPSTVPLKYCARSSGGFSLAILRDVDGGACRKAERRQPEPKLPRDHRDLLEVLGKPVERGDGADFQHAGRRRVNEGQRGTAAWIARTGRIAKEASNGSAIPAASARLSLVASVHRPKYVPVACIRSIATDDVGKQRRRKREVGAQRQAGQRANDGKCSGVAGAQGRRPHERRDRHGHAQPHARTLPSRAESFTHSGMPAAPAMKYTARKRPCHDCLEQHVGNVEQHQRGGNGRRDAIGHEDHEQAGTERRRAESAPTGRRTRAARPGAFDVGCRRQSDRVASAQEQRKGEREPRQSRSVRRRRRRSAPARRWPARHQPEPALRGPR